MKELLNFRKIEYILEEGTNRLMKQKTKGPSVTFQEKYPCPYFEDGRMTAIEYLFPGEEDMKNYHKFLAKGYRRIGQIFYRNICEKCADCKPLRIETGKFIESRSHKRTLNKNKDVRVKIPRDPSLTAEKILLYEKYINTKHEGNKDEEQGDPLTTLISMHYGYHGIIEMDYYLEERLIGVGILDEGRDSLSSNYFYYDTDFPDRRLGILSILKEIALAGEMKKKYYYLGFYIEQNPKMSYKNSFRPNQILENGKWKNFL
jgi:arginine-tRNA-protein transferase